MEYKQNNICYMHSNGAVSYNKVTGHFKFTHYHDDKKIIVKAAQCRAHSVHWLMDIDTPHCQPCRYQLFFSPFPREVPRKKVPENAMQVWRCKQTLQIYAWEPRLSSHHDTNAMLQHTPWMLQNKQGEITCLNSGKSQIASVCVRTPERLRHFRTRLGGGHLEDLLRRHPDLVHGTHHLENHLGHAGIPHLVRGHHGNFLGRHDCGWFLGNHRCCWLLGQMSSATDEWLAKDYSRKVKGNVEIYGLPQRGYQVGRRPSSERWKEQPG